MVNLRPGDDWPDTANVAVDLARVAAWDARQAERYRRGETGQQPAYSRNPQAEHRCSGNWTLKRC